MIVEKSDSVIITVIGQAVISRSLHLEAGAVEITVTQPHVKTPVGGGEKVWNVQGEEDPTSRWVD